MITLQCIKCKESLITLHQSKDGIRPWIALCVDCWEMINKRETWYEFDNNGLVKYLREGNRKVRVHLIPKLAFEFSQ